MNKTKMIAVLMIVLGLFLIVGCNGIVTNTQPNGPTPVPSLAAPGNITMEPYNPNVTLGAPGAVGTPGSSAAPGGAGVPSGSQGQAGLPAVGAAIFMQRCSPCHGNQGQGDIGPALRNDPFITSGDQAVYDTIANGRLDAGMPAWFYNNGGPLNSNQINDLVAYVKTLQNVPSLPKNTQVPPAPTDTPSANEPTEEPAKPSNPGGTGPAVNLTGNAQAGVPLFGENCAACHGPEGLSGIPNPGSEDGTVPNLNPIDPTIANPDPKVFAQNVDLFIEHGSIPSGSGPQIVMPSFGDSKLLTPQQIADIIAYVISLNQKK